jgi:hypothetical protein
MGRPKLKQNDKKIKLSITIDCNLNNKLSEITNNKSKLIELLIFNYIKYNENL